MVEGCEIANQASGKEPALLVEACSGASVGVASKMEPKRRGILFDECDFCEEALVAVPSK